MKIILMLLFFPLLVNAEEVARVEAKGIIFKDTISVIAFNDPTIDGIVCYTTRYSRTMTLGDDSADSSLDCRKVGVIKGELKDKANVFSQDKGFLSINKTTVVDRFYDAKRNVLIYLSYTKSWGEGKNATHSISVVPLN